MNKLILLITSILISTEVLAASKGTGTIADLKYNAINFVLLFGFLGWKLKKPVKEMFDKNAEDVTSLFGLAEEKDKEAQIRLDEYTRKLNSLESDKKNIMTETEQNAATFSKTHTTDTDDLINGLHTDAKSRAEGEKALMARNLNSTLLDEVINKVKEKVRGDKSLQDKATKKLVSQI